MTDKETEVFRKALKKQFGEAKFYTGEEVPPAVPNFTGSLKLDILLQSPFYEGAIVELFGESGSGKTTLALSVLNEAVKVGKKVLYVDQERRLQSTLLSTFPNLKDKLEVIQAPNGNQALQIANMWLSQFAGSLVVIDSVDALVPDADGDKNIGDSKVGGLPRLMSDACRTFAKTCAASGGTIIFLNQIRNKINSYGNPDTTSGGKALPFYASQRIQLMPITAASRIKDANGNIIGHTARFKIVKNSVTVPFVEGEFPLIYGKGVDQVDELVDMACDLDVLQKEGNYITIEESGEIKKRPPKTVKDMMRADPEFYSRVLQEVRDLYPETYSVRERKTAATEEVNE